MLELLMVKLHTSSIGADSVEILDAHTGSVILVCRRNIGLRCEVSRVNLSSDGGRHKNLS